MESELNVRTVETCADPLQYCSLRAQPDWQVRVAGWMEGKGLRPREGPTLGLQAYVLSSEEAGRRQLQHHTLPA